MKASTLEALISIEQTIFCTECLEPLTAVELALSQFTCPACGARVCVMCGCTDAHACAGGCRWIAPGICSTHESVLRAEVERVFGGCE
jgi:hypothetical protein